MSAILLSGHAMLAALTKVPELAINDVQAKTLGQAIANVARHYDTGMDQKTLDWFNLFQVGALVYAPAVMAINGRRKEAKAARNAEFGNFGQGDTGDNSPVQNYVGAGGPIINMEDFR